MDSERAQVVVNALQWLRRHGRIRLHGYSVMPDHLHVVLTVLKPYELHQVMHSLKSYTANEINRMLGRSGDVWARGYHEHTLRDEADMRQRLWYAFENPVRAGICQAVECHRFTRIYQGREDDGHADPW